MKTFGQMNQHINYSIISKLPRSHFGQLTDDVINLLTNGLCCSIYGIPGYGMDFFAKYTELEIRKNFPKINTILLNLELDNDKIKLLKDYLQKLLKANELNEINLSKYLKNNKVIIILDKVFHYNYQNLFKYIRSIRGINTKNLTVFTTANYTILKYTNKYLESADNIFCPLKRLPNFDFEGIKRIIKINNEEYNWNIPSSYARKILFLSGGNPALAKYICMAMYEEGEKIINQPNKLVKVQPLNHRLSEIAELFTRLSIDEQIKIGLLNNNGTIFSDLVIEYLKTNEIEELDTLFPDLTKLDRKILTLFVRNTGKVINKDQLSIILEQTADNYSEWAIYKAVARVRDKIKDSYNIKTLKGRGWIMKGK